MANDRKIIVETDEHTIGYFDMNTGDWVIHSDTGWLRSGDSFGASFRNAVVGSAIVGVDCVANEE